MWRILIMTAALALTVILVQAEGGSPQAVNAALVQMQDCLELNQAGKAARMALDSGVREGLTLRGLFSTLGIGLLSLVFFVPAALIAEYLIRRGDDDYTRAAS